MSRLGERTRERGAIRCPECGVSLRAGDKRCDFCGRKIAGDAPASAAARRVSRRAILHTLGDILKGVGVAFLVIGAFAYFGGDFRKRDVSAGPAAAGPDRARLAHAACEAHIRRQVRAPFRVIAFHAGLSAEEGGGHVVSGTVELQSVDGALQRKRYWCKVGSSTDSGAIVDEGRMY